MQSNEEHTVGVLNGHLLFPFLTYCWAIEEAAIWLVQHCLHLLSSNAFAVTTTTIGFGCTLLVMLTISFNYHRHNFLLGPVQLLQKQSDL